eukprot:4709981-Prymnesium_polylepis.1
MRSTHTHAHTHHCGPPRPLLYIRPQSQPTWPHVLLQVPFALFSVPGGYFVHCAAPREPMKLAPWRQSIEGAMLEKALDA